MTNLKSRSLASLIVDEGLAIAITHKEYERLKALEQRLAEAEAEVARCHEALKAEFSEAISPQLTRERKVTQVLEAALMAMAKCKDDGNAEGYFGTAASEALAEAARVRGERGSV